MDDTHTLSVRFYVQAEPDIAASRETGRAVFKDQELVEIAYPGDRKRVSVFPANEVSYFADLKRSMRYSERFAREYRAFKEGNRALMSGVPLSALPGLLPSQMSELELAGVRTIEQLATFADHASTPFGMGGLELAKRARDFLSVSEKAQEVDELRRQLAELKALIGAKPAALSKDQLMQMPDDDLKAMLRDAGKAVPRGVASKETLVNALAGE